MDKLEDIIKHIHVNAMKQNGSAHCYYVMNAIKNGTEPEEAIKALITSLLELNDKLTGKCIELELTR